MIELWDELERRRRRDADIVERRRRRDAEVFRVALVGVLAGRSEPISFDSAPIPDYGDGEERPVLRVKEAAEVLAVSASQVHRLIRDGRLRAVRFGSDRRVRRTDLDSFIASSDNEERIA